MIKKLQQIVVGIILLLFLSGCQNEEVGEQTLETNYRLYYVNKSYTKVVSVPYQVETDLKIQEKERRIGKNDENFWVKKLALELTVCLHN